MARIIRQAVLICKHSSKAIIENIIDVTCVLLACAALISWLQLN